MVLVSTHSYVAQQKSTASQTGLRSGQPSAVRINPTSSRLEDSHPTHTHTDSHTIKM